MHSICRSVNATVWNANIHVYYAKNLRDRVVRLSKCIIFFLPFKIIQSNSKQENLRLIDV